MAKLKADKVFTSSCDTSVLYPTTGGNIHEFKAITPCAVLDVIGPPYSKEDGRDCSYYKDHPCTVFPSEYLSLNTVIYCFKEWQNLHSSFMLFSHYNWISSCIEDQYKLTTRNPVLMRCYFKLITYNQTSVCFEYLSS